VVQTGLCQWSCLLRHRVKTFGRLVTTGGEPLSQLIKFDEEDDMKTRQKLFMNSKQFVDLSDKMHTRFLIFVQKASKVKKVIKRKFVIQPAAKKTCEKLSGTFCVLKIIQNSEDGIEPRTLKQMTGYGKHKIHKILYKLFKHGEIRIEGGGLYTGVKEESISRNVQSLHQS
jgi:hypothetical protein